MFRLTLHLAFLIGILTPFAIGSRAVVDQGLLEAIK